MNKKKMLTLALAALMAASLTACTGGQPSSSSAAPSASEPASVSDSQSETPEAEPTFVVVEEALSTEEYGIAFQKDNETVHNAVMFTLNEMIADGTAAEISETWFGEDKLLAPVEVPEAKLPEGKTQLIIGLDDSFPPMGFRDENNEIVGFDIDLAREVAARLGVELVCQPIDWATKELELENGNIDCIWNGLTITQERKDQLLMSAPYIANSQRIITMSDSGIASLDDIAGKIVAVQTGSSAEEAIVKAPKYDEIKELVQYPDYVTALQDLQTGRIDAICIDEVVAFYYIDQYNKQ